MGEKLEIREFKRTEMEIPFLKSAKRLEGFKMLLELVKGVRQEGERQQETELISKMASRRPGSQLVFFKVKSFN